SAIPKTGLLLSKVDRRRGQAKRPCASPLRHRASFSQHWHRSTRHDIFFVHSQLLRGLPFEAHRHPGGTSHKNEPKVVCRLEAGRVTEEPRNRRRRYERG